jgi:capsular polysaccharide biosynthesis protein
MLDSRLRVLARRVPGAGRAARFVRRQRGGPLAVHSRRLPDRTGRTVLVVTEEAVPPRWLRPFAGDAVTVADPNHASDELAGLGPVDVLVDLSAGDHERLWRSLFLHVRARGAYVVGRTKRNRRSFDSSVPDWAARLRADPLEIPDHIAPSAAQQLDRELGISTSDVTLEPHALLIGKRGEHLFKVREAALPRLLPLREPQLRVRDVQTLPAGSFGVTADVTHHGAAAPPPWPSERVDYPQLQLRHYTGPLTFGGRMLVHGTKTVLPDSYRWPLADNPENPFTVDAGPEFARLVEGRRAPQPLAGDYFLLDPNYGAFGHIMTEVVGRLWGWDRAKAQFPELKALFWHDKKAITGEEVKFRIPRAYGIAMDDIAWTRGPAQISSLVAPGLMWHNREPFYAHPDLREVWQRIAHGLIDHTAPTYDRVFIGRTGTYGRRTCRNNAEVQRFFTDRGFTVVYPDQLDLGAQAAVFADAKVIAGYGGSGLFSVMFARNLQALIVLNQHSYAHRNEHLFAALLGVPLHYFWSFADISHPPGARSFAATESDWEFDFAHNGAELAELLAQL